MKIILNGNEKVLFMPPNGIGDNLMMLPAAYNLKKAFPQLTIHFLTNFAQGAADIVRQSPFVDNVISYKMHAPYTSLSYAKYFCLQFIPLLLKIRKNKYSLILSVFSNPLRRALMAFSGAECLTADNTAQNQIEAGLSILEKIDGVESSFKYSAPLICYSDEDTVLKKYGLTAHTYVVLSLYGRSASRTWRESSWLIGHLSDSISEQLVAIGESREHTKHEGMLDLINKTPLHEAAVIIKNCKLLVATDGGLMHIGIAQNVPIVALFSTVPSSLRAPSVTEYPFFKSFDSNCPKIEQENRKMGRQDYMQGIDKESVLNEIVGFLKCKQ